MLPQPGITEIGILTRFKATFQDIRRLFFGNRSRYIIFAFFCALFVLVPAWLTNGKVNDRTVAVSTITCGLTTFFVWTFRDKLVPYIQRWSWTPKWKFITIGSLGALWAEFVFWAWEKALGAQGVAASPNLIVDWLVTMPWYMIMVFLLWKVETKHEYGMAAVIVLGGIYELGADGMGGTVFKGAAGLAMLPLLPLMVPIFMIVYSIIVLPCSVLLKDDIATVRAADLTTRKYGKNLYALYPLLGMIPYYILFTIALVA